MNIPQSIPAPKPRCKKKFHWRGGAAARCLAGIALAGVAVSGPASAASYTGTFPGGSTTNFTTAGLPSGGSTTADTLIFATSGTGTAVGTDDIAAALNANILTFTNSIPLTLNKGAGNLITLGGTTPVINLSNTALVTDNLDTTLSANTSFNGNGSLTLGGVINGTGFTLTKNGTGTLTLAGNGTSTLGSSTTGGTILNVAGGTTTFGIAGTDAPTLSIGGNNTGVFLTGGNFNMVNGTISVTENQGLVINSTQTYAQTGGTFTTTGLIEFANGGGNSTVNISGGSLATTSGNANDATDLAVRGTTTVNLSGTGTFSTPVLNMTTSQISGGAAGSTFNLNGGTLTTGQIIPGKNGTTGSGTIFNFNGGTLKASAASTTFLTGLTAANVQAGGALINTNGFNDTIGQALVGSTGDGGLTKSGAGTLTLSGANTYNGATAINAGTLQLGSAGALGSTSGVTVTGGAVLDLFGNTPTASAPLTLNGTGITSGGALINSSATAATYAGPITLGTGTTVFLNGVNGLQVNSVSLVANSGALTTTGAITTTSNSADDTLTLSGTGTAGNDVQSTLSDAGSGGFGLIINKTGTGTWTLGGNGTSSLARGNIQVLGGTLNFGSATEAPTLTTATVSASSPNGAGVLVNGGTLNIVNGTLTINTTTSGAVGLYDLGGSINVSGGSTTVNASQGLVLNGSQTYTQTGGTFTTNGYIELANGGGSSTVNVSAGSLTTTNSTHSFETVRGTSTTTVSGTGTITTPVLDMTTTQLSGGAASSTFNLGNGTVGQGTLVTGQIIPGTNGTTGSGTAFNFNGGTLKTSAASTTFLTGLTAANVQAGGAFINTNGFSDTIGQNLLASTTSTGGGLTKLGAGTLTLTGTNTYTGTTTITAGGLTAGKDGSLGTGNVSVGSNGVLTLTGGTTNDYIGNTASLILTSASNATPFVFLTFTGTDIIGNLSFDGGTTFAQAGTYGAVGSGALFTSSDFSGSGILSNAGLAAAPEPSQYAAFAVGLLGLGALALKARKRALAA